MTSISGNSRYILLGLALIMFGSQSACKPDDEVDAPVQSELSTEEPEEIMVTD